MRKILGIFLLTATAFAQSAPPSTLSRVAGRFVASAYGQWNATVYDFPQGTGVRQFSVNTSAVKLTDGRVIMPFSTNAPIYVGSEIVTPTSIGSGCTTANLTAGSCVITATFAQAHGRGEVIRSATYGLQEALNDAASSGGGGVVIDSAWKNMGGTSAMVSAALVPTGTSIEDDRLSGGLPLTGGTLTGPLVPISINNAVYAVGYGVKANGQTVGDATTSNTSATITCPNNDCNFTSADVGKVVFATNMTQDITMANSSVIVPRSTILTVNSAQSITVSNAATASVTGAARLVWGTLDSAPYSATQTTANDPLFAAWSAAQAACEPLILPAGYMMVEQPEFDTFSTTTGCSELNTNLSTRKGNEISGAGSTSTFIVPTPAMVGTNCTGPNGGQNGCFFSVPTLWLKGVSIFGAGNGAIGSTFNGKAGILVPSISVGTNFRMTDVELLGWGGETTGFTGLSVGGTSPNLSGGYIDHAIIEGFGNDEFYVNMAHNAPLNISNSSVVVCGLECAYLYNGNVFSVNNSYGFAVSTSQNLVTVTNSAGFYSTNDVFPWAANAGYAQVEDDDVAVFTNLFMSDTTTGTYGISQANLGVPLVISNSFIKTGTPNNALYLRSPLIDNGGNSFSGYTLSGAGSIAGGTSHLSSQSAIASAATIAPASQFFHVSGTTQITTITVPGFCTANSIYGFTVTTACQLFVIPDGLFTTGTTGNIALASTAVVGKQLIFTYDPTAAKWYPSY